MSATSDFYLARAAQSQREAAETTLDNVRERCLRAELAWMAMADRLLRSETERQRQVTDKAAEAIRLEQHGL